MNANELDSKVDQMRELKRLREELDQELEGIENEVKQIMTEQGVDELRGIKSKVTWKAATRTSIDTKAPKKDLPDVAAKYSVTTTYRSFRIG